MSNIFDQPWTLLVAAIVFLLAILIYRRIFPDKTRLWQFLLPLFIAAAAFGLDFFIQTDLEKIKSTLNTSVIAVQNQDPNTFELLIAPNYSDSYHRDKNSLTRHFRSRLSKPFIKKTVTRIVEIDIDSPKASVVFTTRLVFDEQSLPYQSFVKFMLLKVEMKLEKQPDNTWLIRKIEIREVNRQKLNWRKLLQT